MPEEEIKEEDKVKRRRFTSKDYGRIENFINEEFGKRKGMKVQRMMVNILLRNVPQVGKD